MSVRRLMGVVATTVIIGMGAASPAVADVVGPSNEVDAYTLTTARLWATSAALLGLAAAIIGAVALTRSIRGTGTGGRRGAVIALAAGLVAVILGVLNLMVATGGPGTGNGVIGGAAAIGFGAIAVILSGFSLARSRRRG